MKNVHGEPLAPESVRMLEYLRERAAALGLAEIRGRVRAAMKEMDAAVAGLGEADARAHPVPDEWTIAQVIDHLAQTQIRSAEELRHLLNGRRPPGPPVYDAITSGAGTWAPWSELLDGLHAANEEMDAVIAAATDAPPSRSGPSPTVRTILLANHTDADGRVAAETFVVDLDWREYALVQRLHLLDHRTQVKKLREALPPRAPR